jgi:hypothetical protein
VYSTNNVFEADIYAILMPSALESSMHLMLDEKRNAPGFECGARLHAPINPGSKLLRRAIRKNIVSFPAQVPAFAKQPPDGAQWRMVLLYFVRGWNLRDIARRFKVPPHRVGLILNNWSVRALALGCVEIIDPEAFAECCRIDVEHGTDREQEEIRMEERGTSPEGPPGLFRQVAAAVRAPAALLPGGMRSEDLPTELPARNAKVIDALDAAISHCEEWGDEFWVRTATLLRDLRTVAANALEPRPSIPQMDGRFTTLQGGKSTPQHELHQIHEEHISPAVA